MRRGHPGHLGLGGWRNENPRHFRPRTGGNQHFRPTRGYGMQEQHRFPPPPSRPHIPSQSFKQRSGSNEHKRHEQHDRGKYRSEYRQNNYSRNYNEGHKSQEKQPYPLLPHLRSSDSSYSTSYPKPSTNYYEGSSKHCHMNNMGDIDDRYVPPREPFRQHPINPWTTDTNVNQFDDRHKYEHNKSHRYEAGESSKLPYDYTGHRPPSNDHYGGNPTPVINNSESFNRSVDDTVNIIRKRLMNRNDPSIESIETNYNHPAENESVEKSKEKSQNFNHEPAKKKVQRQKQSDKSSSEASFSKIKSKIVNQLFKMDKDKIHKLMDNPTSSSKFEYAISSLITESQYSFNRHLRSVAEKSLPTSSSIDFIQNDTNTIYEDTFMKQMQCILEPQDTILLEDLKPIVMAELSKALQLDEYEHRLNFGEEESNYQGTYEDTHYSNEYYDNLCNYEDYAHHSDTLDQTLDQKHSPLKTDFRHYEDAPQKFREVKSIDNKSHEDHETCFEKRSRSTSLNTSQEIVESTETPPVHTRKSLDERLSELHFSSMIANNEPQSPLFGASADPELDDEDVTFEEFDKQYHVAVDEFFINNEDTHDESTSVHLEKNIVQTETPNSNMNTIALNLNPPEKDSQIIKQEIEHQLLDIALSSLELPSITKSESKTHNIEANKAIPHEKQDCKLSVNHQSSYFQNTQNINQSSQVMQNTHVEKLQHSKSNEDTESKKVKKETEKIDTSHVNNKSSTTLSSRKRSIDQSPSHHKEKRKKSDASHNDSDKRLQDKNICMPDSTSRFSKKDDKKTFPEKHTKRKESHRKTDHKDSEKKISSTDTLNSSLSPKENNTVHNKSDIKTTLKTFDIFTEQPKKVSIHQSHRNTADSAVDNIKARPKAKQKNKVIKLPASVQVIKKFVCKEIQTIEQRSTSTTFTQTDKKRLCTKSTQTDTAHNSRRKDSTRSTDTLERMKEIDMEIQALLQEKFKLYNSIESKESGSNSLHTLGMAVVNVSPTEDTIVDDFTSIPVEELEQIAMETVEEKKEVDNSKIGTRNTRLRALSKEKSKSQSPIPVSQKRSTKKGKTPNISLIEQIISDERPIEDIISLDELEEPTSKTRGKSSKSKKKVKKKSPIVSQAPSYTSDANDYTLKDCTVLIVREDFSKYLPTSQQINLEDSVENSELVVISQTSLPEDEEVVNDIQFDMLDVSEDIVIGDVCEVKSIEDKEELDTSEVTISEEIILDNSQSSIEDQQGTSSDLKENECKMFDYSADENLRKDSIVVTGNADAVLALECIENNFIAACLDGNVYYFNGDGQLITTLRGSNLAVTCLTIVKEKYGTTVYTGSLDSRIRYYDLDTGLEKGPECNVLSPIQTMDRAWDTVFVGTRTGFVLQFECKNNMLIPISTVQFSDQSILALRAMKEGPRKVLLVAARSEDVTIKDAQTGLLLRTLAGPKMTVYTLLYEDGKVYCGTSSSQIHVFDYSSGTHIGTHEGGKGAVCLRAAGGLVFAGCYDGCVYVYREGERRPFAQLRGPGLMLLSLAIVGTKIIAGYKDRSLYIWKIPLSILQEMIL